MLVGKDHVGGEGSCWWERFMWLLQDGKLLQKYGSCIKKFTFSQNGLLSVRSQHKSQQTICHLAPDPIPPIFYLKNAHVEIDRKFYVFFIIKLREITKI